MLEASMLVIGDEILGGFVTDTNSGWFADRLREHAIALSCIQTVPDDLAAIDQALTTELARPRPRLIVTSGGLGSTPDDITYEAVAASLGLGLVEDPTIAERIQGALEWTRDQGLAVDDAFEWHMMRMARVPEGATLLFEGNWAPGVRIDVDDGVDADGGASIVILPGVPSQFRQIVSRGVEPALMAGRNQPETILELTHGFPESALNLCFAAVMERYPDVKLGSYPGQPMMIRLRGRGDAVASAMAEVREYVRDLEADPGGAAIARAWADRLGAPDSDHSDSDHSDSDRADSDRS